MGCVYSHTEDNKHKRSQQQQPRKRPPAASNGPSNIGGRQKQQHTIPSVQPTTATVKPRQQAVNNGITRNGLGISEAASGETGKNKPGEPGSEELQFRRQHFDRNSVLRHSKKRTRKNSTASNNTSNLRSPKASVDNSSPSKLATTASTQLQTPTSRQVTTGPTSIQSTLNSSPPLADSIQLPSLSSPLNGQTQDQQPSQGSPLRSTDGPLLQKRTPSHSEFSNTASANVAALLGKFPEQQLFSSTTDTVPLDNFTIASTFEPTFTYQPPEPTITLGSFKTSISIAASEPKAFQCQSISNGQVMTSQGKQMTSQNQTITSSNVDKTRRVSMPTNGLESEKARRQYSSNSRSSQKESERARARKTSVPVTGSTSVTLRGRREAAEAAKAAEKAEEVEEDCGRLI